MNFWEKSENAMFLHSLRKTKFHAKNQKNLSRSFPEKWGKTERRRDRDGPEYKGPPDAIANPSDQKRKTLFFLVYQYLVHIQNKPERTTAVVNQLVHK